ncbi:MAG: TetR/AcrR family transcriptional regulator [Planctomycetes bacterium]|nr:TetR/AcrR family transcriptional regulator [Planctomycetota bacterium]
MPRPNRTNEQRKELIPVVAMAFAELGYRRATTAELARRCGVQENILYRLWPNKKGMFIVAIEHIYDRSTGFWERVLIDPGDGRSAAERLLEYEADYEGEHGIARIVFTGLSEADDPEVRSALARMYSRYLSFISRRLLEHRSGGDATDGAESDAWAIIGIGTIAEIGRELGLLADADRKRLWRQSGALLMNGASE